MAPKTAASDNSQKKKAASSTKSKASSAPKTAMKPASKERSASIVAKKTASPPVPKASSKPATKAVTSSATKESAVKTPNPNKTSEKVSAPASKKAAPPKPQAEKVKSAAKKNSSENHPAVGHQGPSSRPALMKMGFTADGRAAIVAAPRGFTVPEGVETPASLDGENDFILVFIENKLEAEVIAPSLKSSLSSKGRCWIAWPKGGTTDIDRDKLSSAIEHEGLVTVANISLDERWSALKFMYPKDER